MESNPGLQVVEPASQVILGGDSCRQVVVKRANESELVLFQFGPAQFVMLPQEVAKIVECDFGSHSIIIAGGPLGTASFEQALPDIDAMIASAHFD
jgi:hypothetical protein